MLQQPGEIWALQGSACAVAFQAGGLKWLRGDGRCRAPDISRHRQAQSRRHAGAKKEARAGSAPRCMLRAAAASSTGKTVAAPVPGMPLGPAGRRPCDFLLVLFLAARNHRSDGWHGTIGRTTGFRSRSVLLGFLGHLLVALFFGHKYSRCCLEIRLVERMVSDKSRRWNERARATPRAEPPLPSKDYAYSGNRRQQGCAFGPMIKPESRPTHHFSGSFFMLITHPRQARPAAQLHQSTALPY